MVKISKVAIAMVLLAVVVVAAIVIVNSNDNGDDPKITTKVLGMAPYEGYSLDVTLKDFESIGIVPGDDVRVEYSGGSLVAMLSNYYNGIPSYSAYITYDGGIAGLGYFNGAIRKIVHLDVGDTLTLSREGRNKYVDKMPNYLAGYSDNPEDYASAEVFSNFREVNGGDIDPDSIYRSASPWSSGKRSAYADDLLREKGVDIAICMDMGNEKAESFSKEFPDAYVSGLFRDGKVICRNLHPATHSYPEECRFVLETFLETEGKVGFFCKLGKDRTGIYCALLEGLAGATYDEVVTDFMRSLCNYYSIAAGTEEYKIVQEISISRNLYLFEHPEFIDNPDKVDWINVEYKAFDPEEIFTKYLIDCVGMDPDTVQMIKDKLAGNA